MKISFNNFFTLNEYITLSLSENEFLNFLQSLKHDDFIIRLKNNFQFDLVAKVSIGTPNYADSSFEEGIEVYCEFKIQKPNIGIQFFAPVLKSVKLMVVFAILCFGFLAINIVAGLLFIALMITAVFWFNYIHRVQQKNMIKLFLTEINRFKYFKSKGYDYLKK